MTTLPEEVVRALVDVATRVSPDTARSIAQRLTALDAAHAGSLVATATSSKEAEYHLRLVDAWKIAPAVTGDALALALIASQRGVDLERSAESVELIWTGPSSPGIPLRRTDQALLGVVRAADHRLLIVTYVAYDVDQLVQRVLESLDRGVAVRLVLEFSDVSEGKVTLDALAAFGREIAKRAEVLYWPAEKRKVVGQKRGALHAKCAVADDRLAYVSSANLTASAMDFNMELGVLIEGGTSPRRIRDHFDSLVKRGALERIEAG